MRYVSLAACLLLATPCAAADIKSDPLLAKIHAEALQYDKTTFSTMFTWTSVTEKEHVDRVVRYDPSRPEAQRWTYVSRNGKPPEPKKLEGFTKIMKGESPNGYGVVLDFLKDSTWIAGPKTDTGTVYTLVPDDKAKVDVNGINMAKFLKVTMNIEAGDKPYIKSLSMIAPKAFSPRVGATVKALSFGYTFIRRADGDIIPVGEYNKAEFKILFMGNQVDDSRAYKEVGKRVPKPAVAP
jgi:hypothetical protein